MQIKAFTEQGRDPLVLFSGDAFNPSMMSTITLGKQMVPVLNEFGVACSCMGNHDFDYGKTDCFWGVMQWWCVTCSGTCSSGT